MNTAVAKTLIQIKSIVKSMFQDDPVKAKCSLVEDDKNLSLVSSSFILSAHKEPEEDTNMYHLSFDVATRPEIVAEVTRVLLMVIPVDDLVIGTDYFYDSESDEVYYGDEAIHAKYESSQRYLGKRKCPICEKFCRVSHMTEDGICKNCGEILPELTFH